MKKQATTLTLSFDEIFECVSALYSQADGYEKTAKFCEETLARVPESPEQAAAQKTFADMPANLRDSAARNRRLAADLKSIAHRAGDRRYIVKYVDADGKETAA